MISKILVVNVNWLGDVIFSAPVFRALKENYPQAKISCMAHPRVEAILRHIKEIDEIIVFDEDKKHRLWFKKLTFADKIRARHFDIVFLLRRSVTRAFLMWFAGIRTRVGYSDGKPFHFLTHPILPNPAIKHRRDHYLYVLESFGIKITDRRCELSVNPLEKDSVAAILKTEGIVSDDRVIVIHPGGNWNLKRWPPERYIHLIDELMLEGKYKIVISGGNDDIELASAIAAKCQQKPIVLAGRINLSQLVALMMRANVVISADSGPLHIANSVKTDVVGIFGPTRPEITGPVGTGKTIVLQHDVGCNRWACYYLTCPDNICMKSVSVKETVLAVKQLMTETPHR